MSRKYLYEVHARLSSDIVGDEPSPECCLAGRDKPKWNFADASNWVDRNAKWLLSSWENVHIHARLRESHELMPHHVIDYDRDMLVIGQAIAKERWGIE